MDSDRVNCDNDFNGEISPVSCHINFDVSNYQLAVNLGCAGGGWQLAIDKSECTILIKLPECQRQLQTANCQLQLQRAQNMREHTLVTVSNFTVTSLLMLLY
jgi:hypothetical protein